MWRGLFKPSSSLFFSRYLLRNSLSPARLGQRYQGRVTRNQAHENKYKRNYGIDGDYGQ